MKNPLWFLITVFLLGELSAQEAAQSERWIYRKGQTRIMPLGDSITNAPGWRLELQKLLADAGYTFRFVGGRNEPCPDGLWGYHSGFGGWSIGELPVSESFGGGNASWKELQPELILLHIGTNDIQWGHGTDAPARLENLLDRIWKDCSEAAILVAQIIPMAPGGRVNDKGALIAPDLEAYNAAIPGIVARKAASGRRVAVANVHDAFDAGKHLADKCHPNPAGHRAMAEAFFRAVDAHTIRGKDYPDRNLPPVLWATVNGGAAATINSGESVSLRATMIDDDRKPCAATVLWTQAGGPGSADFAHPGALATEVTFRGAGCHILACTAGDGELESTSYAQVNVKPGGVDASEGGRTQASGKGRVISVTFGEGPGAGAAGVVPASNWNRIPLHKSLPQTLAALTDNEGQATTASYSIEGNNFVPVKNPGLPDSPDGKLLSAGYASNNGFNHYVKAIPFRRYDLHLYLYSNSGEFVHKLFLRDARSDRVVAGPFYARNGMDPSSVWIHGTTTLVADLKEVTPVANHLVIPNMALPDLNLYTGGPGDSWAREREPHSCLCGIQVVERE